MPRITSCQILGRMARRSDNQLDLSAQFLHVARCQRSTTGLNFAAARKCAHALAGSQGRNDMHLEVQTSACRSAMPMTRNTARHMLFKGSVNSLAQFGKRTVLAYPSVEGGRKLHVRPVLLAPVGSQLLSNAGHFLQLIAGMTKSNCFRRHPAHELLACSAQLPNLATEKTAQIQQILNLGLCQVNCHLQQSESGQNLRHTNS